MAYSHKVAVAIIGEDGKVYNDDPKGVVKIPFGEYKIRVINKNDKRIGFDVFLGGEKVTKAGKIILNAHDKMDLERWLDFESSGDKLKFVQKDSQEAKNAGKTGEFEGELEIRVHLEKESPKIEEHHYHHHHDYHYYDPWWKNPYWQPIWYSGGAGGNSGGSLGISNTDAISNITYTNSDVKCSNFTASNQMSVGLNYSSPTVSEGATIRGDHSGQSFHSAFVNLNEEYISIKMYLMGFVREKQVEFGFVQEKSGIKISEKVVKYCEDCGSELNKPEAKFCWNCGRKL
jgi:hypothetical protein